MSDLKSYISATYVGITAQFVEAEAQFLFSQNYYPKVTCFYPYLMALKLVYPKSFLLQFYGHLPHL